MKLSIRSRTLFVILASSVIPVTLLGIAAAARIQDFLFAEILEKQCQLIEQVRLDLGAEFAWYTGQLDRLAGHLPVQSLDPERSQESMDTFLSFHVAFSELAVYDSRGCKVSASARSARETWATSFEQLPGESRAAFQSALQGFPGRILASSTERSELEFVFLAPIPSLRRGEGPVGVLAGIVRREGAEIQDVVDGWSFADGTYLYLTATDGSVVATAGTARGGKVRRFRLPGTRPDRGDGMIAGVATVLGREDILASKFLAEHQLVVIVGRPYDEVRATLRGLLDSLHHFVLMGVLVALILGFLLSGTLAGPIVTLTEGIQRVARGEVGHRLEIERADELGDAANAFNEMTSHLQRGRLMEDMWQQRRSLRRPGTS